MEEETIIQLRLAEKQLQRAIGCIKYLQTTSHTLNTKKFAQAKQSSYLAAKFIEKAETIEYDEDRT